MSVAVARPAQALRRRDAPRPTLAKRSTGMDGLSEGGPAGKKRKLNEPYVRDQQYILRKHKGKPASLTIHLHPTYFRFDGQDGSFAYDSPMRFVISHLRKRTVPHEMMMELLENNVPFYDGCLIVEVHNHIPKEGKEKGRSDSAAGDDEVRFSMNNYNEHVTPSPLVEYPKKARTDATPEKGESSAGEMAAPERPKEKEGPRIATVVLEPTPLSQHHELLILANTPASEVRNKKRGSDGATPSSAQPPTPSVSVPPTPVSQTSRGSLPQSQKMCLEEGDFYTFQSDLLMATEPPLFLDPVDNPQDSQRVLDMLSHPLHQEKPPSPKTRKRTTAEVAADDAQAAETERMLLIMDDRIKPTAAGAAANENQGAAAALSFSRFKTIEIVRQKIEEAERVKKEEEQRATAEKNEEQQRKAQRDAREQKQREVMMQQQQQQQQQPTQAQIMAMRQQQQQQAARAMAQQQLINAQNNHAHPSSSNGIPNQHQQPQQNFQQTSMTQSSPVVRQQTPMNSSPMTNQGSFPMVQTSSQGAGSPQRPTSMPHPMVRQVSQQQQQQGSRHNTPQITQPTPNMAPAMPNRQMTQTPRMPPGSPAVAIQQGTPTSMPMPTPNMANNQFTPEQIALFQQQQRYLQAQQNHGNAQGSPPPNMTPEQFQLVQRQQAARNAQQGQQRQMIMSLNLQLNQASAAGNQQLVAQIEHKKTQILMAGRQQGLQQQQQQQMLAGQMHGGGTPGGLAGSPANQQMNQQTPQVGHGHPGQQQQQQQVHPNQTPNMSNQDMSNQQLTPQQQQINMQNANLRAQHLVAMRRQANQQQMAQLQNVINPIIQQYGGLQNVPPQVIAQLPQQAQQLIKNQMIQRQQQAQQAQQAMRQQNGGGGGNGQETVPAAQPNPQYMQQLRQNQAMLMQHQNSQQGGGAGGGMNMGGMSFHMNGLGGQQGFGGNGQQGS